MSFGKKQKEKRKSLEVGQFYKIEEALEKVVSSSTCKFDETVDVAIRLGIDAKQSDQQVRGAVVLPHGIGKTVRVLVFAKGPKEAEAKEAGADYVGGDDLVEKIKDGWMEFDAVVATPDMMGVVSKVGKILGPRGLMPNPKLGTVTFEVNKAVSDCKAGKVDFRNEKAGVIHAPVGKVSFGKDKLADNLRAFLVTVQRLKPQTAKGIYFRSVSLSSTMGPGLRVDLGDVSKVVG